MSRTIAPRGTNCLLALDGPRLFLVSAGPASSSAQQRVLWYSDIYNSQVQPKRRDDDEDDDDDDDMDDERDWLYPSSSTMYIAQLDNDGSLAVYKLETVRQNDWYDPSPSNPIAKAWVTARQHIVDVVLGQTFPSPHVIMYKTCVYATGPMGCHRIGRRLLQLVGDTTHLVQYCWTTLDEWFDAVMEFVFEEDDPVGFFADQIHRSWNVACQQVIHTGKRLEAFLQRATQQQGRQQQQQQQQHQNGFFWNYY